MAIRSPVYLNHDQSESSSGLKTGVAKIFVVIFVVIALIIGFMVGILIGRFAINNKDDRDVAAATVSREEDLNIFQKIQEAIDPAKIEANLKILSQKPHIAGKQRDFDLVKLLKDWFQDNGLTVQTTPYDVLLSYPSKDVPNSVRLLAADNSIVYDAIRDESNFSLNKDVVPPYNAYSPSRTVEGKLVYAGYGRNEDYKWLAQNNISVSGNLVIVKYGRLFRGDKVDIAASNGAIGIIIYSDPADCTGFNTGDFRVYPETWWLPPTGAQRGTIFTGDGDPLTPGYPANSLAYRFQEDSVVPPLPSIPCHPIGYGAAIQILQHLGGLEIPTSSDMHGGLRNLTYRTGPDFLQSGMKIQLNVTSSNQRAKAENVFGIIKGTVEPDRYVLIGNHRDAWIYGAIDPSSGTAVLMELARVMGELVKKEEWKPRRTIIFCSWGAEEFGLIGSTEWVEHYVTTLRERAVAYINVDIAVEGNDTLTSSATPLMYNIVYEATQKVKNPNPLEIQAGRHTVFDTWVHTKPWNFTQANKTVVPLIGSLGSGSDFAPLLQRAGVTAVDLRYTYDNTKYKVSSYPLYHTEYETFNMVKEQFDKNFEFHAAIGRVSGEMARSIVDSVILPFNLSNYAVGLELHRQALDKNYGDQLKMYLTDAYEKLESVIDDFRKDILEFEARINSVDKNNPYAVRTVNDQILLLEKAFLHPEGLPARPLKKHLIFAENMHDAYAGSSFPGLLDILFEIGQDQEKWEKVKRHFHTLLTTIQGAGVTLREVTRFMSETI